MSRRLAALVASSAGLVVWGNVVVPRLPPGPVVRAAVNAAGAVAMVGAARARGYGWRELGLAPESWTAGARLGGPAAGAVVGSFALLLATSPGRAALSSGAQGRAGAEGDATVEAARGSGDGGKVAVWGPAALRAGLTIPIGTVLAEEVAFRGVLQAMAERRLPPRAALAWCAGTFSTWHLAGAAASARPTPRGPSSSLASAQVRPRAGIPADAGAVVVSHVLIHLVATGLAGVVFGLMRRRAGSVLAPVLLHLATNSGGLLAAATTRQRITRLVQKC